MAELSRPEVTISYSDQGDGATVALLHGHTFDRRVWRPVLPALLDAGCRVVRPDLRGHGLSSRPDRGYHVSHHAGDLIALLDHLGIERAAIAGFSFGGGVALEAALTHPERVAALALISTTLPDRPFEPIFMDNLREVARTIRSAGVAAAMAGPWLSGPLFARSFTRPGVREATLAIVRDFPGAEFLAAERDRVERGWTVPERLAEITAPTVVMVGEHELPGFRGYADEIAAAIPGATLDIVPDRGHLLPLEAPDAVARMIIGLARP
ncbi:MAG: alpha/beta hydrolase [Thermoanaerobaculales bacterium]|jgi:pimeloyl-ACP methyl ester carboxylesterase|nr:alpha/beta hydrolase [Thermoanaerobaculales bacterium]